MSIMPSTSKVSKYLTYTAFAVLVLGAVIGGILVWHYWPKTDEPPAETPTVLECVIYPFETNPHPLIVLSGNSTLIYPKWPENVLRFSEGQPVDFICPGTSATVLIDGVDTQNGTLTGTCSNGTTFNVNGEPIEWPQLVCSTNHWRDIRTTGTTCASDGQLLEAGFYVDDGRFIPTMTVCFNTAQQIAYYTYIEQTSAIFHRVLDTPRPGWLQGSGIYALGSTITNLYLRSNQQATVNGLLGLPSDSEQYIQSSTDFYLARGHMTARSDNYYAAAQNATFYMQNIAPQWQTFNGMNWNQIEIDVRDYASDNGVNLQVWTGVYGISTLPNVDGEETQLYLFVNDTAKLLPVPEIFWKAVYNPETERGVAIIGINNPYNSTFRKYCFDVSDRLSWLHCDRNNQEWGFCYACSITTLRYIVSFIPYVNERGLLL